MWTCKHCGQEVDSQLHECWNCGAGINWLPPTETQASIQVQEAKELPASKEPPYSSDATGYLRIVGVAIGLIAVIAGIIVLANLPDAPNKYSRDAMSEIQRANRMIYLVLGATQIIAGITTGVFLYVVAGIGDAGLDLWKAQQHNR